MQIYRRALSYFRQDAGWIALLVGLFGISIGLGLLQAWPTAVLIDAVLTPTPKREWVHRLFLGALPSNRLAQVFGITLIGMGMKFTQDLLTLAKTMLNNWINYRGRMRVRGVLYRKLQELDLGYHRQLPQGDAIYRITNDTVGCDIILNVMLQAMVAAVTLVAMTSIMLSRNVWLTVFALSITPLLMLTNWKYGPRIKKRSTGTKEADATMTTVVQRSMTAVGLMQSFGRQEDEFAGFWESVRQSVRSWLALNWQEQFYRLAVQSIFTLGGAIIFGYGGYLVYRDQFAHPVANGITCGDLTVFMVYLGMMWEPLTRLTSMSADIQPGAAGAERVFEVLDRAPAVGEAEGATPLPRAPRTLALENVSFGYAENRPVLHDINAKIGIGEMVAFVGPSGAGKSTLLNLLSRFYDPAAGAIRLDGADVRTLRLADVRSHIAVVGQDATIVAASVAENIRYGRPDASAEDIQRAAQMAGAAQFIADLPEGYASMVSEGGQNLSGGQRQRLAIARALLTAAPILVLDEPTSALDSPNEERITQMLQSLRGERTVVLVSHHLKTVVDCDQIFVLDEGQIVERGTHEELLRRGGLYRRMAEQQLLVKDEPAMQLSQAA